MYRVNCIILAAGRSTRMNMGLSKQFIEINGKPIIYYSISRFINHNYINKVILVLDYNHVDYCRENIIDKFFQKDNIEIVIGGESRQHSVYNALGTVESEYVIIHDGARPFIREELITRGIHLAHEYGASSCYVIPKDTIRIKEFNKTKVLDRDRLICVQTPQCFKTSSIVSAYECVINQNKSITDETSALDLIGGETHFYLGDYFNIKITTQEDLYFGSVILNNILGEM